MSLILKILATCVAGIGCISFPYAIKPKCSHPNGRWVEPEIPFLHCKGQGKQIDVFLAFKESNGEENGDNTQALYLKGVDHNTGETVNLYEQVDGGAYEKQNKWSIHVFTSNTIKLMIVGMGGGHYDTEKEYTCTEKVFKITKPKHNFQGEWEEHVAKVTFKPFERCTQTSRGKVCDIEIADTVGLQWETNFKPKAHFCSSSK